MEKSPTALKTIGEAAEELGVETHVLRFWEKQFPQISPLKQRGGRRYYRPDDMEKLREVKALLYQQGFTIQGAKQQLKQATPKPSSDTPLALLHRELSAMRDMIHTALQ